MIKGTSDRIGAAACIVAISLPTGTSTRTQVVCTIQVDQDRYQPAVCTYRVLEVQSDPTNKHIPNNPNPNPNTYGKSWTTLGLMLGLGLLFLFSEYAYWFATPRRHGVTRFNLLWTANTTQPSLSLWDLDSSLVPSCACSISNVTVDVGRDQRVNE